MPQSLCPHVLRHDARFPCPSLSPWVWSNSCPLGQWCHPTISPSVAPFSFVISSICPSIRVFSSESVLGIRWPKYWSFSFSINPSMNIQDWFPLGLTGWISLQSRGLSRVFSNTTVKKHQFFGVQPFLLSSSVLCPCFPPSKVERTFLKNEKILSRHFTKETVLMTRKQMKMGLASFVIRKMQINTIVRHHFTSTRIAKKPDNRMLARMWNN